ncbi:AMP-binding protein [bacterium]|nr:AMP-binding protein [bacterium]
MISEALRHQQQIQDRCFHPSKQWVAFQGADFDQSVAAMFEAQAVRSARRCAVKTSTRALSYAELNGLANQIAHMLLATCASPIQTVALCFEIGAPLVTAMVAITKLGRCQVVLDPKAPPERNAYILDDAQVNVILTDQESLGEANRYATPQRLILNVDKLDPHASTENLGLSIAPEQIVRLIYTSGSTGQPKGVGHRQRNLLYELLKISNVIHLSQEDRQLLHSRNGFGAIFRSLLSGATVYPFDIKRQGFLALAQWMAQEEITILQTVPTVMHHFTGTLEGNRTFPHLRLVILSGEALYRQQAAQAIKRFPGSILMNTLGSQESYYYRVYFIDHNISFPDERVAVGYALPGSEVQLVDNEGKPVVAGEIGEIKVISRYLAAGYWRKPELTATRFLEDPTDSEGRHFLTGDLGQMLPDGQLLYWGRKDYQIKVRGFQVDVNDVEKALHNVHGIDAAAVTVATDNDGATRLIAYIATSPSAATMTASSLRRQLTLILPEYMIPSVFVFLEALPITAMGKVNRQALPTPTSARPQLDVPIVAPRTPTETIITQIWCDVLGLDKIGVEDDFLDLGGHSLQASQIVVRVLEHFQVELPSFVLFEASTVVEMAKRLLYSQLAQFSLDKVDGLLGDLEAMSEAEVRQELTKSGNAPR